MFCIGMKQLETNKGVWAKLTFNLYKYIYIYTFKFKTEGTNADRKQFFM